MKFIFTLTISSLIALTSVFQSAAISPAKHQTLIPVEITDRQPAETLSDTDGEVSEHEWTSLGMGRFTDGLAGALYFSSMTWEVEVEQNAGNPALYRIVNPYTNGNCPWNANGIYSTDAAVMHYVTFDTSNPDAVFIDSGDNVRINLGVTISAADGECQLYNNRAKGRFSNSIIRFESNALAVTTANDGGAYYAEMTKLALPGAPDYDVILTVGQHCFADNHVYFSISGANDATQIRSITYAGLFTTPSNYFDQVFGSAEPGTTGDYEMTLTEQGWYTIFVGAFDHKGSLMSATADYVYAFIHNEKEWKELGIGQFTDDSFTTIYEIEEQMSPYDVKVYENLKTPGLYRIENPYASHPLALDNTISLHSDHPHYLDIDASDFGDVKIVEQPFGFNINNEKLSLRSIESGTLTSEIIRFPTRGLAVRIDNSSFYANQYGRFTLKLPDPTTITEIKADSTESDSGEEAIFDLQGRRLRSVPAHGPYITGGRVTISR
ncbi:MAG: hypothetical protein K2F82_08545 [Muribaculaceae bacterium]|nr:hypothetical protein [Muribaculaceae bacterium]